MPKLDFTIQELQDYFNEKRFHLFRKDCRDAAQQMRVHADGITPEKLLNDRRPNEPTEVMDYRKKIFVPKTKPYFSKIESTLQKIRRSSDWNIKYENGAFDRIQEEENLESYCEEKYPVFGSVTNWAFSLLMRQYLIDANSVVLIRPEEIPEPEKYVQPVASIFSSDEVIDFEEGDYAVLQNKVGCMYQAGKTRKQGKSFYIVTTQWIRKYDQTDKAGQYQVVLDVQHGLNELPVFKTGGVVQEMHGKHILYESRISGILPEFNEALREYSDLQAAKVLHLYPERWEFTQNECKSCKGSGRRVVIENQKPCEKECNSCAGAGYIATGPYSKILIKPGNPATDGMTQMPTPPAGFVEKDVEIIKVQETSIQDHLYYGLSAINFEHLAESPLSQSGVAKSMDQDGANNTVHSIAEDIVRIMDSTYRLIALYRYSAQYTPDEIENMLPKIAVPEKYDIISGQVLAEQIKVAKENKANPVILNAMEVEYALKTFNNDSDISDHVNLVLQLDPLANISEDDKMSRLSNKGILQETYVISSNINAFVQRAMEENTDFIDMDPPKQREIIAAYAQEIIDANDEAAEIAQQAIMDAEQPVDGEPVVIDEEIDEEDGDIPD